MEAQQIKEIERFVSTQRSALMKEIEEQIALYGIRADGTLVEEAGIAHLPEEEMRVARQLRQSLEHRAATTKRKEALDTLVREQSFTVINRMVALRMAEERGIIGPSVSAGPDSEGFQVYCLCLGSSTVPRDQWYIEYLNALFDELSVELPVLFDRFRAEGLVFPREKVFRELLQALNAPQLQDLWAQDETLGWIYQYFNDPKERKKMREKSSISTSYELAVRNQFFTPRYVVQFLVDNSLGRFWAEATADRSALGDAAQMLALAPEDELHPQSAVDPRALRVIDPACGSMHFGLYAFDLLTQIYQDAYTRGNAAPSGPFGTFARTITEERRLIEQIPVLILGGNLMGIDIDRRAIQIAGLTLYLRAHRWWHDHGVPIAERPRLPRIRLATAQPMPGEDDYFKDFVKGLRRPALGKLAAAVRSELELAGLAGSLLQVEKRVEQAVRALQKAKDEFTKGQPLFDGLFPEQFLADVAAKHGVDTAELANDWESLEQELFAELRAYAHRHTTDTAGYQHSLFADDTEAGLAFVDLLREPYHVVLMNPPFGESAAGAKKYIEQHYPRTKNDLYAAFTESFLHRLVPGGYLGAITSRTGLFLSTYKRWREEVLLQDGQPVVLADLGFGVLDAMVETAAYVVRRRVISLPNR